MTDGFLSPRQLLDNLNETYGKVPNDRLFSDPKYQKYREEWAAARLGSVLETLGLSVGIRVISQQNSETDFEISVQSRVIAFQFTEVQKPGRKRGQEYKERKENPLQLTPEQPQRGTQEGPAWIAKALKEKVVKNYAVPPHLLVYANFEADNLNVKNILSQCCIYRPSFRSFWVLQNHRLIQVWESTDTRGWARQWVPLPNGEIE